MIYMYILSWLSLAIQSIALTFAIGSGLYYLAEIIEEYSVLAKRLINFTIITLSIVSFGLIMFENLPIKLPIITLISNLLYFVSLRTFPFIDMYSPVFISSIALLFIHHYVAFSYFANNFHEFYEVITYFTLFCWVVPILLLMSLSANDNALPQTNQDLNRPSDGDYVTNYLKRKAKRYGLLTGLRYFQENYLPRVHKNY